MEFGSFNLRPLERVRCVNATPDEIGQITLALLMLALAQSAVKSLIPQPNPISVHNIRLAIVDNLLNLALEEISLDFVAVDALGLSGQPHNFAEFVQRPSALVGQNELIA